ncbi:MAG: hypothetical protein M3276_01345 [Actinomycetota bacterium]|nr:hypothetical protein [Actinomycetota bacterium]
MTARVIAFAAVGLALWVGVVVARRTRHPVYRIDVIDLVVLSVAIGAVLCGALLLARTSRPEVGVLAVAAATLASLGVLALFSVGLILLGLALLPGLAAARRVQRDASSKAAPAASGVLIVVGLAAMVLMMPLEPAVNCRDGGVATAGRWRDSSVGGASTVGPDGSATGTVRFDGEAYAYRCEDGDLVELRRIG